MENVEIARALSEIADLLEIRNDNPFKIRAYRSAVRTITDLTRPLSELVAAGTDLTELPGIGHDIAHYIRELLDTGHTRRLTDLQHELPGSLAELMRLDGIGPRRARQLHDELGVDSVAGLRGALDKGRVEGLRGFGPRTVERLKRAVAARSASPSRLGLSDADQFARTLLEWMAGAPGLERIEVAGSYRRRRETVGDLDLLAICEAPSPVMQHFTRYPEIARLEAAGDTRGTAILESGLHVDLRILPAESFGAALHYFTGSKAHNIAVRRLGVARGLRISEYGVFRRAGKGARSKSRGRRIGGAQEQDVFDAVGMAWVPPELREDHGEIAAALDGSLPHLVSNRDIRGDLQAHSDWTDGRDSIEAMAREAHRRGYAYLAITDHGPAVTVARGLEGERLRRQKREMLRVRRKLPDLWLLRGMEVDILPDGSLDLDDEVLADLDIVLVAVHSAMNQSRTRMTDRIIRALHNPFVHLLAHPTGRLINVRPPYEMDLEAVLTAAADLGVAVELNAQPSRLDLDDVQVRRAKELGVRVAIDTDAHSTKQLEWMRYGIDQARRGWLEKVDVLNTMSPAALREWLLRRRKGSSKKTQHAHATSPRHATAGRSGRAVKDRRTASKAARRL